ncbi:MAG: hypothetical protein U0835_25890 [Isosphaeraceae bacterium]
MDPTTDNPYEAPASELTAAPLPTWSQHDKTIQTADIVGGLFWTAVGGYFGGGVLLGRLKHGPSYLDQLLPFMAVLVLFGGFLLFRAARRAGKRSKTRDV